MSRLSRCIALAIACAIASFGLAACGGSDDDDSKSDSGAPAAPAPATGGESTRPSSPAPSGSGGAVDDDAFKRLRDGLVNTFNVPEDKADCVVDKLRESLSDEDVAKLNKAFSGTEVPESASANAKAREAAKACGGVSPQP